MGKRYKQEPPFCVQVELTLGCNLACSFCGINGVEGLGKSRRKDLRFMSVETAKGIALAMRRAEWNPRIEFARRGEPSLNPDMKEIIGVFRQYLPKASLMMTSNGAGFMRDPSQMVMDVFQCGLNVLALDAYEHVGIVPKIREKLGWVRGRQPDYDDPVYPPHGNIYRVCEYPQEPRGNPHKRRRPDERVLTFVQDISSAGEGTHATLNNHAGYAGPQREYMKPCAKPFRELSVDYDGSCSVCCIAWAGEMRVGNIVELGAEGVWQHARMNAARRKLLRGERDFGNCAGCDHPSYRVGLLPDKKGHDRTTYPKVTSRDRALIREMEAERPPLKRSKKYQGAMS